MANTLLTPNIIARAALANLYETTVMAPLVHRDYEPEFAARRGDTITIRKPAVFTAEEYVRANGITIQDATESGVDVTLNHFADVSFAVTAEDLTLKIQDFNEQLLAPAMEAIAQKIDRDLLAIRDDITAEVGQAGTTGTHDWDDPRVMIDAGKTLNQANVPLTERRFVFGPVTAAAYQADPLFHEADRRGDTDGLMEAAIGRKFGLDNYMTQNISVPPQTSGNSTTEVGVAFHRTAVALAFRPLALPRGAQNAAIETYKGFGLRVVYDYDIDKKQDVVSIDCLYGVKTLDADRAVLVKGADVV
ncbi:hypothetical protein GCM10009799_20540 [Nocardiopsis rhodophaea]|uniref:P22 coat protein Gp5 n=1 Tax=Nocardiopsis rhodophaea TaxID=280238 RepID=A0ABP5EAA3_9ACTN